MKKRPSPRGRSLSRAERAEKRKELVTRRAKKGMGDLVLVSKEKGTKRTFRGRMRTMGTGLPEVSVTEERKGKKKRVVRGSDTRRYF